MKFVQIYTSKSYHSFGLADCKAMKYLAKLLLKSGEAQILSKVFDSNLLISISCVLIGALIKTLA